MPDDPIIPSFHGVRDLRGLRLMELDESILGPITKFFQPRFGRMFPGLPSLNASTEDLEGLGQAMTSEINPIPTSNTPAGFTYFGQFVDHDITLDTTSLSEAEDDPWALRNFRSPRFDLDSMYGSGPIQSSEMYQDQWKLLLGEAVMGDDDTPPERCGAVPRSADRTPLIGDKRNDENLVVAQLHLTFLRFHNRVVDRLRTAGVPDDVLFDRARRTVQWHYQWVVINDYLKRIAMNDIVDDVLANGGTFYNPTGGLNPPFMPVEFAGAAYRFGHSQVRQMYDPFHQDIANRGVVFGTMTLIQNFTFTGLFGGSIASTRWPMAPGDWASFLETDPSKTPQSTAAIDIHLADTLGALPHPELADEPNLAVRNLLRGIQIALPSGQSVASTIGATPLTPAQVKGAETGLVSDAMATATPLWFYVLREAQVQQGGQRLGEVGSRIVAEVLVGLLRADKHSYINQKVWCLLKPPVIGRRPPIDLPIPSFGPLHPPIELEVLTAAGPDRPANEVRKAMKKAREIMVKLPEHERLPALRKVIKWPPFCNWKPFLPGTENGHYTLAALVNFANGVI